MAFQDARLLEYVSYGFTGGPTFNTTRARLVSGYERRNAERSRPLYRFRAPYDGIHSDHHAAVQSAYIACLGPTHSFRFKDWSDYQLNNVTIGTTSGGTDEAIQIIKPYTFGSLTVNRTITKPVDSTVYNIAGGYVANAVALAVTADDTPISFTCDYSTGILTLTGTRPGSEVIKVTGEFDVPVFFDEDSLEFDFIEWEAHSGEIRLTEDFAA